jgi:hypothetical protein
LKKLFYRLMNEFAEVEGSASHDVNAMTVDPNETFENMDYESDSSKAIGEKHNEKFKERIERAKKSQDDLEEKPKETKKSYKAEKVSKEEKKGTDLDLVKDEDELDGKDEKEKTKEKKSSKKDEDEDEETEEEKDDKESKELKEKSEAKKLKIRQADGLYGIDADAKVRVKIDGEFQEVPVQELINQYSGKVAYDKKFSELGQQKKEVEHFLQQNKKQADFLKGVVAEVTGHLSDKTKNPLDALNFIVEKSGFDSYDVWKRTLEANLEEVEKLMSMSELERENYFLKKEGEFRTKSEQARKAESAKETAFNQAIQKVDSLRQAQGVSEDQFVEALDELEAQGVVMSKVSDEQVVEYASLKPHVSAVQDVLEPYEAQIDDSKYSKVVQNLARQLRAKEFSKEQLIEWAKKEFMDEDLKDLQSRTKEAKKVQSKAEVKTPAKLETLDFDEE